MGQLRGRNRYASPSTRRIHSPYLLSGLAHCQYCGSAYSGYELTNRSYYVCTRAKAHRDCPARHVPAGQLENGVIKKLLDDVLTVENMLGLQAALQNRLQERLKNERQAHNARTRELRATQTRIRNLTVAIAESGPTRALLDALARAERERDDLELKNAADLKPSMLPAPIGEMRMEEIVTSIRGKLLSEDRNARRDGLRACVVRVLIRRDDKTITGVLEYKSPDDEESHPGGGGGELLVDRSGGPDGVRTVLLTITLTRKHYRG